MRFLLSLCLFAVGCGALSAPVVVGPVDRKVAPVPVSTVNPAKAAVRQLVSDRADNWDAVIADVRSGKIKTVSQLASASLSADEKASDRFNAAMCVYLQGLLDGADGDLPDNAADKLSGVPQGFRESLK